MEELPLDLPDSEMEADDGADDRKEAAEEAEGQVQGASSCDCCPEADEAVDLGQPLRSSVQMSG